MAATRFAKDHLRAFVERIERLEEEKKGAADDIRDVYAEAKGNGFDVKALRAVIKIRKLDRDEWNEFTAILDTYLQALGMLADTPLGRAAVERDLGETKVSLSMRTSKGEEKLFEGTSGDFARAADRMKTPAGKRAMRRAASTMAETDSLRGKVAAVFDGMVAEGELQKDGPGHYSKPRQADTEEAIADRAEGAR